MIKTFAETYENIRKEVEHNEEFFQKRQGQPSPISDVAFVNGKVYEGEIYYNHFRYYNQYSNRNDYLDNRPRTIHISTIISPMEIYIVNITYGKLRKCKFSGEVSESSLQVWDIIDAPELKFKKDNVRIVKEKIDNCFNGNGGELVFVDGDLFDGKVTFDRYKGCGWLGGRTYKIEFDKGPKDGDVYIIDLSFGRLRKCKIIKDNIWKVLDDYEIIQSPHENSFINNLAKFIRNK